MKGSGIHRGADCGDVGAGGLARLERGGVGITGGALGGDECGEQGQEESDGGKKAEHCELVQRLVTTGDSNCV